MAATAWPKPQVMVRRNDVPPSYPNKLSCPGFPASVRAMVSRFRRASAAFFWARSISSCSSACTWSLSCCASCGGTSETTSENGSLGGIATGVGDLGREHAAVAAGSGSAEDGRSARSAANVSSRPGTAWPSNRQRVSSRVISPSSPNADNPSSTNSPFRHEGRAQFARHQRQSLLLHRIRVTQEVDFNGLCL